jgi:hypothetical protein
MTCPYFFYIFSTECLKNIFIHFLQDHKKKLIKRGLVKH